MMTICADEALAGSDETYWVNNTAAPPVLLIDEATEAITEALHRARCGSMLDDRDLAAAWVALGDLFGGLGQLVELLSTSLGTCTETDAPGVGRLEDQLATLRATMMSAQGSADELRRDSAALRLASDHEKIPRQRA
jgi:hypothetical protein